MTRTTRSTAVSRVLLSTVQAHEEEIHNIEEAASKAVHNVEAGVHRALDWTRHHRRVVRAATAGAALLYGSRFSHTILLAQTVRVTAGDSIMSSLHGLGDSWKAARKAIDEQAPNLAQAPKLLEKNKEEMKKIMDMVSDAQVSRRCFRRHAEVR